MKKSIFTSKTFWINLIMATLIILPEMIDLGFNIPLKWSGLITVILNVILRFWTTQPVSIKGDKKPTKLKGVNKD